MNQSAKKKSEDQNYSLSYKTPNLTQNPQDEQKVAPANSKISVYMHLANPKIKSS